MSSDSYLELPPGFDPASYEIPQSPVTRRLRHLEVIELGDRALTVHHTPGHSPGSICLLDDRDGILFTGDTYYSATLIAHHKDSDFGAYHQSVKHLIDLLDRVSHLCPSHNEAYAPKEMFVRVLDAFEQITAGKAAFELHDGTRVYHFDGFGVRLPGEGNL